MTMMKMGPFPTVFLSLICCVAIISAESESPCEWYAALGGDFVVPLNYKLQESYTLSWTHDLKTIFKRRSKNVVHPGKPEDINKDGSLILRNLTKSMEGKYKPEIYNEGNAVKDLKGIQLCLMAPVPTPTVKEECVDSSVKLTCKVDKGTSELNVAWSRNNVLLGKHKDWSLQFGTNQVPSTDVFTCNVSNLGSFAVSEPLKLTCLKPFLNDYSIWFFVGGGGGIVLVLILIVIICCIRTRRSKRMRLKEEGELRLRWTNTEHPQHPEPSAHQHLHHQHQHHHPHHQGPHRNSQQQPAGHTGPRPSRSKQHRSQQHPRGLAPPTAKPRTQPSPRRPAQAVRAVDTSDSEQPPPLPQPRKTIPRSS